jgi:hypothetical protein
LTPNAALSTITSFKLLYQTITPFLYVRPCFEAGQ